MLNGFTEETISGQKVVKVFNHEEIAIDEFAYLNEELKKAQIKSQFQSSLMGPATHQLCNVVYAVTACVGGILVVKRGFDIGGLTISLNYTRQFNRPINEISMQMNTVFAALAGAERVFEVLDEEPEKNEGDTIKPKSIEGKIEVSHVDFGYAEGHPVLRDITLYAKPGQKIAFVGSTGAGKTTITNLLPRFYELQAGEIKIDGIPIHKLDKAVLRSNIAMVLQDTHLFTGTVRENIRYGRLEATDEEVVQAAKAAFAHSFIMQLEKGYDTLLENDGANLSQGQRQLLNIARAAISKAPILILDEATSSVDTRTEKHIEEGMDALMENRTTMVIAHRLSTVRKSNVIMVLEQGRIVERGTHDELIGKDGYYKKLHDMQACTMKLWSWNDRKHKQNFKNIFRKRIIFFLLQILKKNQLSEQEVYSMTQLSEKELNTIKDLLSEEELLVKKFQMLAEHADKEELKCKMESIAKKHQGHFNELYQKLS